MADRTQRDLYDVAKEAAEFAVSIAQCAGYEVAGRRAVFFRSDIIDLAETIHRWLGDHMEFQNDREAR